MADLEMARGQLDALQTTLDAMDRLKPDADVGQVVRVVLEETIDAIEAERGADAVSDFARHQVRFSSEPMNPAAGLKLVGDIASRL